MAGFLGLVEGGAEFAAVLAREAERFVDGDAGDGLSGGWGHDAGFVAVDVEAFGLDQPGGGAAEAVDGVEIDRAGEGEVVGVAGVGEAALFGEAGEAAVEANEEGIANARAGGGALHAMAGADGEVVDDAVEVDGLALSFSDEDGEGGGDAIAVTVGDEESADAGEGDGGKEILEIDAQEDALADVGFGAGANVATFAEAVSDVTDGEFLDEERDEAALDGFELAFGGHDEHKKESRRMNDDFDPLFDLWLNSAQTRCALKRPSPSLNLCPITSKCAII